MLAIVHPPHLLQLSPIVLIFSQWWDVRQLRLSLLRTFSQYHWLLTHNNTNISIGLCCQFTQAANALYGLCVLCPNYLIQCRQ